MSKFFSARIHDRFRLEFKIRYPAGSKNTHYKNTFWIYLPPSIESPSQFETTWFQNRKVHTRFQAPQVSIHSLLDNTASSPIFMLRSLIHLEYTDGFTAEEERLIRHHARLLACSINRAFFASTKAVEHAETDEERAIHLKETHRQVKALSNQWKELKAHFLKSNISEKTRNSLHWSDEAIGNQLQLVIQDVLMHTSEEVSGRAKIIKWMHQNRKRIQKLSPHYLKASSQYLLRASALKKYTFSALFLKGEVVAEREWLQQVLLGVAAGIAMTWAVFAQVFAFFKLGIDLNQGMNSTLILYFFLIAVVSYILKDRIKATAASYLSRRFQTPSKPLVTNYHHEERRMIATATEQVSRISRTQIPKAIQDCWSKLDPVPMDMWVGGDFICYDRHFKINHQRAEHTVINYSGIHDIIRYNVSDWLNQFDDAKRHMVRFKKDGRMSSYNVDRIYEIILSVELKQDHSVSLQHYRIQISQKGLQNIQKIRSAPPSKSIEAKVRPNIPLSEKSEHTSSVSR